MLQQHRKLKVSVAYPSKGLHFWDVHMSSVRRATLQAAILQGVTQGCKLFPSSVSTI